MPLVLVKPSNSILVTSVVEVSFAKISLKDFGSLVVDKTSIPPYLLFGTSAKTIFKEIFKTKIEKNTTPLVKFINQKLYRGVTTGCNDAFIISEETKTRLIEKDKKSGELIKKFLTGKDIKRYEINFNKL
ncbi:MAG: hypothetical protein KJ736_01480, partial [Candidatus Omnitrophica bacterium]|nr:hypothetical protein [Candidatus Omnitrophota bacterium]